MVEILVKLLNEKYHYSQFNINLLAQYQPLIEETLQAMADDLIAFNANKPSKIQSLMNDLQEINLLQNLSVLSNENLLDPNLLRNINKALVSIFFTSVDYKIPEKKPKEEPGQVLGEVPGEGQPDNSPSGSQGAEPVEAKPEQSPAEVQSQGSEKILDALEEGQVDQPIEPQEEEEEFKLPEIMPIELAMVEAKKKLRLNYVNDWDYRRDCDGIVRWRVGLNRAVHEEPPAVVEEQGDIEEGEEKKKDEKEVIAAAGAEKVEVPEPEVEDRDTMLRRLIENDDFIEPFDGSTFEKEKLEFPGKIDFIKKVFLFSIEKEIKAEEGQAGVPLKIYNAGLVEGKYVVQINERGQNELRRGLLGLVKEIVPEWKNVNDEDLLEKAYNKYKKNEKVVLDTLISDPEQIPIFDLEN